MGAPNQSLLLIPTWNQLRDPLADGEQDPFADTDCGEECAAMRIYYRTGIALPAGIVRQLIPGKQATGVTSAADLVAVMRIFGLRPVARPTAVDAIHDLCGRAVSIGIPPIVLGYWDGRAELHWVLVVGASPAGVLVNDPWGGLRRTIDWDTFDLDYAGWCIT